MATDYQIIGLQDASGVVNAYDSSGASVAVTISGLDTTTYPDRAVFRFYNPTGTDATVGSASIRGKVVARQFGRAGYKLDDLLDYESIRTDGPNPFEMENEYLINTTQIEAVADWYWKTGRGKHVYQCDYPGARHWFEVGDWYQLTFSYILDTDYIELIDSLVQVEAVETEQNYDSQGSTRVIFKEVEESWGKTQIAKTNLVFNGSGKNKPVRSTVVVGSSTYTGFADYLCDGTADDVEIQAAIDYLSATFSGGNLILTEGVFNIAAGVAVASNISIGGAGGKTIIRVAVAGVMTIIDCSSADNISLYSFVVDGNKSAVTTNVTTGNYVIGIYGSSGAFGQPGLESYRDISVINIKAATSGIYGANVCGFRRCSNVSACISSGHEAATSSATSAASALGFFECVAISSCFAYDLTANGGGVQRATSYGLDSCYQVSLCSVDDLSASNGTSLDERGFYGCNNVTQCSSIGSGAAHSDGFVACSSMQQNKSTTNANHYINSYADAGTSNPCADTASGGFNS